MLIEKGLLYTPLQRAVINNQIEVVKWLLSMGANIHCTDHLGYPLLFYAILCANERVANLLIDAGAKIDEEICATYRKNTLSLTEAILTQTNTGAFKLLLKLNPNPHQILHTAATIHNNTECLHLLLQAGAEVKSLNEALETPLYYITRFQNQSKEIVEIFKEKDEGITEMAIQLKMIGHRFGIKGLPYEGSSFVITLPTIIALVGKYIESHPQEIELFKQAYAMLQDVYDHREKPDYFIDIIEKNAP